MQSVHMRQLLRVFPVAVAIALIVPAMAPTVVQAQSVDGQRQKVADIVDELERLEEKSNELAEPRKSSGNASNRNSLRDTAHSAYSFTRSARNRAYNEFETPLNMSLINPGDSRFGSR